jgi:flagellar basal-body rod protein FlgB
MSGIGGLGSLLDTQALRAARTALTGLSRRHEAISANVANIDTPGYQRREVTFESALAARLSTGDARALDRTHPAHVDHRSGAGDHPASIRERDVVASRNDGNDVSIDEEMLLLVDTQLRYQALTQSIGRRLGTLRTVIRG